ASEIVAKLEKIAFEDLKLVRLEIRMDLRNKASEKVAIKNNFVRESLLRKAVEFQGKYYDNLLYTKVR
ncbi:MAG TPA: N-acetyltransferase, partial [Clostridium sp.]|nr:N-acetyltransferase [Clostridium sp.]